MVKFISLGHRCSSAGFLQLLNLKTESYPFDWLVSKLKVIQDCIETQFVHFLQVENYIEQQAETCNFIDGTKVHICNEIVQVNTYYETDKDNRYTYQYQLALNHRHLKNDLEYYQRCIQRFNDLLETKEQKYTLYFHPIMGINDYSNQKENLLHDFDLFSQFITQKTTHLFGIYFILVQSNLSPTCLKIKETPDYIVFLLHCNDHFLDGGKPCMGHYSTEQEQIMAIFQEILQR